MDYLFVLLQRFPHFQQHRIISDVLLYPYYHLANLSRFKRPRVKFTPCNQDALATSIFPIFSPSSYPSFSGLRVLSFSYFLIAAISVATILLFSLFLSLDVSSWKLLLIPLREHFCRFENTDIRTRCHVSL